METIEQILEELAALLKTKSEAEAFLSNIADQKQALEAKIRAFSDATGLKAFNAAGIAIKITDKMRPKYDPALWSQVVKWAVETGNDHIIQRRLTGAKIEELVENGTALPEGLTLESYPDLSIRHTK